jgi:hypothetical protein
MEHLLSLIIVAWGIALAATTAVVWLEGRLYRAAILEAVVASSAQTEAVSK